MTFAFDLWDASDVPQRRGDSRTPEGGVDAMRWLVDTGERRALQSVDRDGRGGLKDSPSGRD